MSLLDPALLRPAIFGFLLLLLLGLEAAFPRRRDAQQRIRRWPVNLSLALISSALLALLPIAALGTAWFAEAEGIGLFHAFEIPAAPLLTWLLLDLSR